MNRWDKFVEELSTVWSQFSPESKQVLSKVLAGKKDSVKFSVHMDETTK